MKRTVLARLTAKGLRSDSGCLEYTGPLSTTGYGKMVVDGKVRTVHRLAWETHRGTIPDGMCVCHHCDNRRCMEPTHLFIGTHADNAADRSRKGRSSRKPHLNPARGERVGLAKLTTNDVVKIRRLRGVVTGQRMAALFGVSDSTISAVLRRHVWKHV
jgi:hypothetical protein